MNTIIFACSTLRKELLAAMKENNNHTPIFFLPREVHTDPKFLHTYVQDKIDRFCQVDRIVICTSGCGGGTIGLTATTAEIVIPRTRDCLDILLSGNSLATLETLAVIAMKEPVTRAEIEKIRGVSAGRILAALLEKELVEERGRLEVPGRPILYGTTKQFLKCTGLSSVSELKMKWAHAPDEGELF